MSKVICDVCGTSFPETATQCPICGCVRSADVTAVDLENEKMDGSGAQTYTYVKGGRFSKTNVRKRNQGIMPEIKHTATDPKSNKADDKGDRGLVIAICTLLLAIVAVVIYIVVNFFSIGNVDQQPNENITPDNSQNIQQDVQQGGENTPEDDTTQDKQEDVVISCTGLTLSHEEIKLDTIGSTILLSATKSPAEAVEEITFTSENPAIATVSETGEIKAVAMGETAVVVQCGQISARCRVVVMPYKEPYRINKTDVSIDPGETFQLKLLDADGQIVPVEWTVGDSEVCTVEGNTVSGVANGRTTISVTFDGAEYKCKVYVRNK